jgi:hypothetical protein
VPFAERISRAFGVSPSWLLFGEQGETRALDGEREAEYHRRLRVPCIEGEPIQLPAGLSAWRVPGRELEPVWHAGQMLLVVRAAKGEAGPAVIRVGRTGWRIVGVLF